MSKETVITFKVTPSLNRAITFVAHPLKIPIYFSILYHKVTTAIQFKVDTTSSLIKNREVQIGMFRNLENCKFCQTFFKLESQKDSRYDIRAKFAGTNRMFEREVFQFQCEKLDLNVNSGKNNRPTNNYLLVLGWKLVGMEDDLLFFFVQRRGYNSVLRTNIIRTVGLQFSTKRGNEFLNQYYNRRKENIEIGNGRVDNIDFLDDEDKKSN